MKLSRLLARSLACLLTALLLSSASAGANTLRWASARDVFTLDPHAVGQLAFLNHVYEGLVRFDENYQIKPALAESWEVVEPTVWRFKLRQGVTFHNGESFTADDVIASLKRMTGEFSPMRGNLSSFKEASKIDDHTVEVHLNRVNPLLLRDLTGVYILNHEWLAEHNAEIPADLSKGVESYASRNANGTGPFMLESYQPDVKSVLVVNPKWWDTPQHNLTRIEYTPIISAPTRVSSLLSGEIDFTESAPLQDLDRLSAAPDIEVLKAVELRTVFFMPSMRETLFGSTAENPLRDLRVRKALYQAVDADLMQKRVMRGLSRISGTVVAPALLGYSPSLDERLPLDPEASKALLAEAGYPDGFPLTLVCATDFVVNEQEICQAVASMWSRIGVKVNLNSGPRSIQFPKQLKGEFDMTIQNWAGEPPIDSFSILSAVVHSKSGAYGVHNWGGWSFPAIDEKIAASASEMDEEKRIALMNEALTLANEEALFIPLHQQPIAWATRSNVAHVLQMPDNRPRHWFTRMK